MRDIRTSQKLCRVATAAALATFLISAAPPPLAAAAPPLAAAAPPAAAAPSPDPGAASVIARYQQRIPQLMAEQNISGLSVAVVDGGNVLWAQGFGYTDENRRKPITTDTIFSVQSMSKLFTATAVMEAVQAGRVQLDAPITTYLPDFTVHSAFEDHPEQKITLRMLLSHTAGFTHEAPIGNNYELEPGDFDSHVRSISDTWLRFPVGTGYAYSNLGIDLAGYILEKVYGTPFATVMDELVLAPTGMDHSTFDRDRIRTTDDRAIGHVFGLAQPPLEVPMSAAGGLYASASDLAAFLRFQLGNGTVGGRNVLDPTLMEEMRTVPAPHAGEPAGYALGVARTRWRAGRYQDLFSHGGGGFGFLSDLWFLPQVQLGIAVLTNSSEHDLQGDLALSILYDLVTEPGSALQERMLSLPYQSDVIEGDGHYQPPATLAEVIAAVAAPSASDQAARWNRYVGYYRIPDWGVISPTDPASRFMVEDGVPYFVGDQDGTIEKHRMVELAPGRFISDDGEVLDFTAAQATWRNLDLIPVTNGPLPWQWALLAVVGGIAIVWLAAGLLGIRRRRRQSDGPPAEASGGPWRRTMSVIATLAAVFALATIALIALAPGLVDSGFLGWLELPPGLRLALHLPLAVALLAVSMVVFASVGWARRWWAPRARPAYVALTVATSALTLQLAAWNLLGWGLT